MTESQLMAAVANGDAAAFEALWDLYSARALRVAGAVCREPTLAEDAVQDAFLCCWESAGGYRAERGTVVAWLMTLVRHRAIDLLRRSQKHTRRQAPGDSGDERGAPITALADLVVSRSEAARLHAALGTLPEAQHEVIVLAFFGDLTHKEIASQLNLPAGTVKGRMRLGLHKLRDQLDPPLARVA